ncbi:hypothetical protein EAG_03576 [Camponotus floridanus]|uniref:Uncharacterized protein n=1 Tax=Camponotus floridanus TaxID=104421 RepID=E2ANX4_CAMFO|nr:hypothetical protein EAG_03576 [Camponotus floridanus]
MAMKVKKAVVGRVRMLERPPRSDEGQLGQSIPQPVVAAAIERARRTAKREETVGAGRQGGAARVQRQGRRLVDGAAGTTRKRGDKGAEVAAGGNIISYDRYPEILSIRKYGYSFVTIEIKETVKLTSIPLKPYQILWRKNRITTRIIFRALNHGAKCKRRHAEILFLTLTCLFGKCMQVRSQAYRVPLVFRIILGPSGFPR